MTRLSDAIEAVAEIEKLEAQYMGTIPSKEILDRLVDLDLFAGGHWRIALDWIEKALPWVDARAERLQTILILARAENDAAYDELIADASEELAALDALLAEAKGENHAEN